MIEEALRLSAEAVTGRDHSGHDGAERLLRAALAERPDDHRLATVLASLLIRWASAFAQGQWAWTNQWFEEHPFALAEDDLDEEELAEALDGNLWVDVADRHDEAERLLHGVLRACPADPAATLVLGALWLDRWMLHSMVAGELPDEDPRVESAGRRLVQDGLAIGRSAVEVCPANPLSTHLLDQALAAAGELSAAAPPGPADGTGYSWYVVHCDVMWHNNGELNTMYLVTTDPAEVWQACRSMPAPEPALRNPDVGAQFVLTVYAGGRLQTTIDLADPAGPALAVPDLSGERLPFGMPVLDRWSSVLHHGYSIALW